MVLCVGLAHAGMFGSIDDVATAKGELPEALPAGGVAVLNADGKELFAQPEAAAESKESFYPQLRVPGALSLKLDSNVPAATYTLVVTVHDKIGGQTAEYRDTFRVE